MLFGVIKNSEGLFFLVAEYLRGLEVETGWGNLLSHTLLVCVHKFSGGFAVLRFYKQTNTWGACPFLFSSPLSPACYKFSSSASCPRHSSFSFSPPPLSARAPSLYSSSPSTSRPVCHVVSSLTSPLTLCLCVGVSSLFQLPDFPSLWGTRRRRALARRCRALTRSDHQLEVLIHKNIVPNVSKSIVPKIHISYIVYYLNLWRDSSMCGS